jgi:hypothetical protein
MPPSSIDAFEIQQTLGNEAQDSLTGDERIEDAYGDVRMRGKRRKAGAACIHVIHDHTHSHAAIRRFQQLVREEGSSQVGTPDEGLKVEAAHTDVDCPLKDLSPLMCREQHRDSPSRSGT